MTMTTCNDEDDSDNDDGDGSRNNQAPSHTGEGMNRWAQ